MKKRTVTISGTEFDLVTWAIRGLVAVIVFFLVQLYIQVQSMDKRQDRQSDRLSKIEGKLGIEK